jgi:hypothetical protein
MFGVIWSPHKPLSAPSRIKRASGSKELVDQARTLLLAWLERKREKDDLGIYYAGRTYSTRMLIDEIERQSEIGRAHISMFMEVMRKAMRI